MYGSSQTGFGLRSSNLNLDLQICKEDKPHLALIQALDLIKDSNKFKNVEDDFSANLPCIRFKAEGNSPSGLDVELSLNNHHALQTSSILQDYMELDPRVRVLGVNFRYWAALTKLDKQAEGTLSPHTFPILLIYFLQRTKQPVVPCIHEFMEDSNDEVYHPNKEKLREWKSENADSVAELWIQLFQFYSLAYASSDLVVSIRKAEDTTNEEKDWKSKKLAIEDPYSMKRNLCRSIQHPSVFNYIADCFKTGYLYFGTIQTSHGPIITKILPNQVAKHGPIITKVLPNQL
ncbi:terminal uridylyltransferase 7 [Eurytemora carolleeae]|uniref:terminal uridylyltransferase 7 n=1 Tax=Eurytemora carolleeae TaxID=1294199 RepID=UPI000C7569CA|nr:terminal uridylyltransferase 7 [Eurytemora carolleeae]|eukprot:XP_023340002.1 terminal uridylyltransferase 7-like [Eurytemora affinis]